MGSAASVHLRDLRNLPFGPLYGGLRAVSLSNGGSPHPLCVEAPVCGHPRTAREQPPPTSDNQDSEFWQLFFVGFVGFVVRTLPGRGG